jgi:hypothetical protein
MSWWEWIKASEPIALWVEGIALVLIFIWDRKDAAKNHKETLRQIDLAQKQIAASHNAERAWVMTELSWYEKDRLHIVSGTSAQHGEDPVETTTVDVKLTCRNEGRSPAWIDKIYGYSEIMTRVSELRTVAEHKSQSFGWMGPIAPGKFAERTLTLICPGHIHNTQMLSLYVVVDYRDIFDNKRMTSLGYTMDGSFELYRQEGLPERNRNT